MPGLTEAEEVELLSLVEAEYGGESLSSFVQRMSGLAPPLHIENLLIPHLEAASREPRRLVICMPPRHAKSHTVMHALVWHMLRNRSLVHAYVSYNDDQTAKFSRKIRRLAEKGGLELDANRLDYWTNTAGGGLNASSSLTGEGITGWMVIDDPFKDREQANSGKEREKVWEWYTDVAYTRLQPGASVICIQTRWHEEDLAGRLIEGDEGSLGEPWEVVELPAVREPRTGEPTDDFERGIALWPEMYPLSKLKVNYTINPNSFWSLYQQRPRPKGNRLFNPIPSTYDLPEVMGARGVIICDPAATAKTSSDYTAIGVFSATGLGINCRMYVLEVVRVQLSMDKVAEILLALQKKWGFRIGFEGVAGFKTVPEMAKALHPKLDIFDLTPLGDKYTRAQPASAAWNQGRVLLPVEAPWKRDYVNEMKRFTGLGDSHDDQVDVTSHGWNVLYRDANGVSPGAVEGGW